MESGHQVILVRMYLLRQNSIYQQLQLLCRSMEGLKEEEEKKKLKEKDKMTKLVKNVEMDKFTEEKTRYKN